MRRFLAGSILLMVGVLANSAMAADFPVKAPAYEAIYNWTGFYAGVNVGGGWGRSSPDVAFDSSRLLSTGTASSARLDMNGALGGFQAGYNAQTGRFVFGVETDIQASGQKGDGLSAVVLSTQQICIAPCVAPPPSLTNASLDYAQKLSWFGTLRGRVGFTPTERTLFYATGGLAYGEIGSTATFTLPAANCVAPCTPAPAGSVAGNFSQTRTGWVVGAGLETAIAGGWTAKLEYLHVDFGTISNSLAQITVPPFIGTLRASGHMTDEIVRVGVNYRFGEATFAKY
jgi:outer membrane immunogenic protein